MFGPKLMIHAAVTTDVFSAAVRAALVATSTVFLLVENGTFRVGKMKF